MRQVIYGALLLAGVTLLDRAGVSVESITVGLIICVLLDVDRLRERVEKADR